MPQHVFVLTSAVRLGLIHEQLSVGMCLTEPTDPVRWELFIRQVFQLCFGLAGKHHVSLETIKVAFPHFGWRSRRPTTIKKWLVAEQQVFKAKSTLEKSRSKMLALYYFSESAQEALIGPKKQTKTKSKFIKSIKRNTGVQHACA